jgi:hypothetical protein
MSVPLAHLELWANLSKPETWDWREVPTLSMIQEHFQSAELAIRLLAS